MVSVSAWTPPPASPSSQRVWIEISKKIAEHCPSSGRPLHRGCGLKFKPRIDKLKLDLSPSSQRVWIEIAHAIREIIEKPVALFTEGVD